MKKTACPFSQRACRDCPLFRGRHYRCPFHKHFNSEKDYTSWQAGTIAWEMPDAPNPNPDWFVAPDIDADVELGVRFGLRVPVLERADGATLDWPFDADGLGAFLSGAES